MVDLLNTADIDIPDTQYGHRVCDFLGFPQPGHLTTLLTSFSAFPAKKRDRLFEWEVFFFGTALRMPSQMSDNSDGMLMTAAGRAIFTDAIRSGLKYASVCLEKLKRAPLRRSELERVAIVEAVRR